MQPSPGSGGTFTYAQLEALWINAGGPRAVAPIAAAIAEAESGGNPDAQNPSGATGLWQILGNPFPGNAKDPQTNAKMAVAKYKQAPGGGNNFSPWVTFTTGAYKGFVNNKTTPDFNGAGVKNPGGGGTSANTSSTSPPVPGCLIGIPIPSGLGFNWNPVGGSFGPNITSSEICLFNRSQARALIGGLLLGTGTLTLFVGTAILVASAFKGNKTAQGAGHGAGTVMEAAGAGLALIPGAEAAGAGVAASGAALRRGGKAGRAGNAAQARKSRRQAGAREDAQLERRVGEPRENPNLRTGRGAIRETPGETRRRRSISPGGQPASRSEAGF